MKALACLDERIYTIIVCFALTISSEECLVLINHCLELVVGIFAVIPLCDKLTDELNRLLGTRLEVINLIVCRIVDDSFQVPLPEVIINGVFCAIALLDADVEV